MVGLNAQEARVTVPANAGGETPPEDNAGETPEETTQDSSEQFDADRAKALIDKLRKESAAEAKARKAAEAKAKALETAQMTEAEKATARLKELEAEKATWEQSRRQDRLDRAVALAAARAGASGDDVDLVSAWIGRQTVTFSDAGEPENVDDLVKEAKGKFPALFGGTQGGQPPRGGTADAGKTTQNGRGKVDNFGSILRR